DLARGTLYPSLQGFATLTVFCSLEERSFVDQPFFMALPRIRHVKGKENPNLSPAGRSSTTSFIFSLVPRRTQCYPSPHERTGNHCRASQAEARGASAGEGKAQSTQR